MNSPEHPTGPQPVLLVPDPDDPTVLRPATGAQATASAAASASAAAAPGATTARGAPSTRPSVAFMASHPAHAIALGFGSGLSAWAPGTVGTLWGWASFVVMQPWLTDWGWALVIAANLLLGWWACTVTARHMSQPDSSHMVWDEVVAFWIVLWILAPADFWMQLYAFALFRLFDAVKVGPMAWADQTFKGFGPRGGFGVMLDDLAAAFCTLLVIAVWRY
jgi:phosphatidylglycerophosphatase A